MACVEWDSKAMAASFARLADRQSNVLDIENCSGWPRMKPIREFYRKANPEILESKAYIWAIDPYEVDWIKIFTPIELAMWHDIRSVGAVLYPQYPVGNFFADFANPVAKVVVECDGAAFHQNTDKDRKRDAWMRNAGWDVYRAPGSVCLSRDQEIENEHGATVLIRNKCAKFLDEICRSHSISSHII